MHRSSTLRAWPLSARLLAALAVVSVAAASVHAVAADATETPGNTRYSARELAGAGGHSVWPYALGPTGAVVGRDYGLFADAAGRWSVAVSPQGVMHHFKPLDAFSSQAYGVNAAGTIVGDMWLTALQNFHPYLRLSDGTTTDLFSDVTRPTNGAATGVNAAGVAVGWIQPQTKNPQAFVWRDGQRETLGDFGGGVSAAAAINDAGVIVGYAWDKKHYQRAFRYRDATMQELGNLPGVVTYSTWANAVAPDGTAVGGDELNDGSTRTLPTLWRANSDEAQELRTLPGGLRVGEAFGVNAADDIVGTARDRAGAMRAVLWRADRVIDLTSLVVDLPPGIALKEAIAINDSGLIVVNAFDATQTHRHFLLTPLGE